MSRAMRLSEKWFNRGLWLVAFLFAYFLIGLGGTVVGDLPKVEEHLSIEDFMDAQTHTTLQSQIQHTEYTAQEIQDNYDQAQLALKAATADYQAMRQTFENWLATRHATKRSDQDRELIQRTTELDGIRQAERTARAVVEAQEKLLLDTRQAKRKIEAQLYQLRNEAAKALFAQEQKQAVRVFLYRLAVTLPLLIIAALLFVKQRKSKYWPFVWGFIIFALFAFFVELVPYMPSYGGYVRYSVGIIITLLVGRYVIIALNRYIEQQKSAEQLPDAQRKNELSYDLVITRLSKGICPGCERPANRENDKYDFCQHCGIHLFDHCNACQTRKNAFSKFCFCCGKSSHASINT